MLKGQDLNYAALWALLLRGIRRPSLYLPACSAPDIRWVDFAALRRAGYEAICFDKDNTLTLPYQVEIHLPLRDALLECRRHFDRIAVLSNSVGNEGDETSKKLEASLGIPIIRHQWKKPLCTREVVDELGCEPARIVMVGDRLATDVWMANESGMLSIHTRPLSLLGDNPNAIRVRHLENWILDRLERPFTRPDLQSRFIKNKL